MWQWALEFSRSRKARKSAVATILPIVEGSRRRLGGISDVAWSDPYVIGFLVMLISIVARLECSKLSRNSLSAVQCAAWEEITAITSEMMAEQLLVLSADRNRDFEIGCDNAATFSTILFGNQTHQDGAGLSGLDRWSSGSDYEAPRTFAQREDVATAWSQFFDAHLASSAYFLDS